MSQHPLPHKILLVLVSILLVLQRCPPYHIHTLFIALQLLRYNEGIHGTFFSFFFFWLDTTKQRKLL